MPLHGSDDTFGAFREQRLVTVADLPGRGAGGFGQMPERSRAVLLHRLLDHRQQGCKLAQPGGCEIG